MNTQQPVKLKKGDKVYKTESVTWCPLLKYVVKEVIEADDDICILDDNNEFHQLKILNKPRDIGGEYVYKEILLISFGLSAPPYKLYTEAVEAAHKAENKKWGAYNWFSAQRFTIEEQTSIMNYVKKIRNEK